MKVQFVPDGLRIRVDHAEFAALRDGRPLALALAARWRLEVRCGDVPALDQDGDRVDLTLPAAALDDLATRLPSREGIDLRLEAGGVVLDVSFEVDLRDGRPRRPR